jgi:uncharacterized membrane protein YfbV (UPF0208 family)
LLRDRFSAVIHIKLIVFGMLFKTKRYCTPRASVFYGITKKISENNFELNPVRSCGNLVCWYGA